VDDFQQYKIDYENGTIPVGELTIGDRVVDPSWVWEFRTDRNYTGSGEVKPVSWIIVAKDHYEGLEPHVTVLAVGLIGIYAFDDSTGRSNKLDIYGSNHWGDSGSAARGPRAWLNPGWHWRCDSATRGLRPWLNSTGIHENEGFYLAFSKSFKRAVLKTIVPNKKWKRSSTYRTRDRVFLPSTTELGDREDSYNYQIGKAYPYFEARSYIKRVAMIGNKKESYWTRSPNPDYGDRVSNITDEGDFRGGDYSIRYLNADYGNGGGRPALNLKSGILVSEIRD